MRSAKRIPSPDPAYLGGTWKWRFRSGNIARKEASTQVPSPVHHGAGAEPVGEPGAGGADDARGEDEDGGEESRLLQRQAEDVDVVLRQPQRQSHVAAEHEEVVEAEAPQAHVLEGREHLGGLDRAVSTERRNV
jgi:hypothetical protein